MVFEIWVLHHVKEGVYLRSGEINMAIVNHFTKVVSVGVRGGD